MSSEDSFRRWHIPATPPQPLPSHSDRSGYTYNTYNDNDNLNDSDGMHNGGLDNRDGRLPRWRRALKVKNETSSKTQLIPTPAYARPAITPPSPPRQPPLAN
ncbi:hypothetical protein BD410DRAFT_336139 [Rickenella mellea]|uniref:Uncharacterized protein n=1 Tax=Rickenella mellea TaxID=50990 RepID=A0A4Y7QKN6_9AGAM|nr:hypothetical protein BD410DRAFT_336139 [Rickenella mellea]